MITESIEKLKKKYGVKHLIWGLVFFVLFIIFLRLLSDGSDKNNLPLQEQQKSVFDFIKSPEKRFNCEDEKIENLKNTDITETKTILKIIDIHTNTVEYPLNKKEVMAEYCITVANLTSNVRGSKLLVQFLDKDNNVLVEKDDYIFDIPGKRTKTIYGSEFIETQLSKEITTINISTKN